MKLVRTVRLSQQAEQDFADILVWTVRQFGVAQAETYAVTLRLALREVADGAATIGAKARDDISPGVFLLHVARAGRRGRHLVAFRVADEHYVDVLRILHESMALASHLSAVQEP